MKKVNEKVLKSGMKKVYNTNEINKWVKYGLDMGYIDKTNKEINLQMDNTNPWIRCGDACLCLVI